MPTIISSASVSKTNAIGFCALDPIELDIEQGELFALLDDWRAGIRLKDQARGAMSVIQILASKHRRAA